MRVLARCAQGILLVALARPSAAFDDPFQDDEARAAARGGVLGELGSTAPVDLAKVCPTAFDAGRTDEDRAREAEDCAENWLWEVERDGMGTASGARDRQDPWAPALRLLELSEARRASARGRVLRAIAAELRYLNDWRDDPNEASFAWIRALQELEEAEGHLDAPSALTRVVALHALEFAWAVLAVDPDADPGSSTLYREDQDPRGPTPDERDAMDDVGWTPVLAPPRAVPAGALAPTAALAGMAVNFLGSPIRSGFNSRSTTGGLLGEDVASDLDLIEILLLQVTSSRSRDEQRRYAESASALTYSVLQRDHNAVATWIVEAERPSGAPATAARTCGTGAPNVSAAGGEPAAPCRPLVDPRLTGRLAARECQFRHAEMLALPMSSVPMAFRVELPSKLPDRRTCESLAERDATEKRTPRAWKILAAARVADVVSLGQPADPGRCDAALREAWRRIPELPNGLGAVGAREREARVASPSPLGVPSPVATLVLHGVVKQLAATGGIADAWAAAELVSRGGPLFPISEGPLESSLLARWPASAELWRRATGSRGTRLDPIVDARIANTLASLLSNKQSASPRSAATESEATSRRAWAYGLGMAAEVTQCGAPDAQGAPLLPLATVAGRLLLDLDWMDREGLTESGLAEATPTLGDLGESLATSDARVGLLPAYVRTIDWLVHQDASADRRRWQRTRASGVAEAVAARWAVCPAPWTAAMQYGANQTLKVLDEAAQAWPPALSVALRRCRQDWPDGRGGGDGGTVPPREKDYSVGAIVSAQLTWTRHLTPALVFGDGSAVAELLDLFDRSLRRVVTVAVSAVPVCSADAEGDAPCLTAQEWALLPVRTSVTGGPIFASPRRWDSLAWPYDELFAEAGLVARWAGNRGWSDRLGYFEAPSYPTSAARLAERSVLSELQLEVDAPSDWAPLVAECGRGHREAAQLQRGEQRRSARWSIEFDLAGLPPAVAAAASRQFCDAALAAGAQGVRRARIALVMAEVTPAGPVGTLRVRSGAASAEVRLGECRGPGGDIPVRIRSVAPTGPTLDCGSEPTSRSAP